MASVINTKPVGRSAAIDLDLSSFSLEQGIDLIEKERVRPLLEYLKTGVIGDNTNMSFMKAYSVSSSQGCYRTDFETAFLKYTAAYYQAKVTSWMAENSCPQFLALVSASLENEELRLKRYLDRSSEGELRTVCQRELILNTGKLLADMDSGCKSMLLDRRHKELSLMFKLFRREPSLISYMTAYLTPYIEDNQMSPESVQALFQQDEATGSSPIYIRNTFLHSGPDRSPSSDRFIPNRLAKSCPVSANASELGSANIDAAQGRSQQQQQESAANTLPFHNGQGGGVETPGAALYGGTDASSRRPPQWAVPGGQDAAASGPNNVVFMCPMQPQSIGGEDPTASPSHPNSSSMWVFSPMSGAMPVSPQQYPGFVGTYAETTAVPYPMGGQTTFGSTGPTNSGSAMHGMGTCKPCAFAFRPKGCPAGAECTFCHLCDGRGRKTGAKNQHDTPQQLEMPFEE